MFSKFKYKNLCKACIRKVARNHNIQIHVLSVMPEHIHMLITMPKGMSDEKGMQLLKGVSAYYFFKHHPKARLRYSQGYFWGRGGCAVTVGYNQFLDTERYILNPEQHYAIA